MSETKATEQLAEAEEMLDAGWTKMDSLEWKRWGFVLAVRLMSALVYSLSSIREEIAYWEDRRACREV